MRAGAVLTLNVDLLRAPRFDLSVLRCTRTTAALVLRCRLDDMVVGVELLALEDMAAGLIVGKAVEVLYVGTVSLMDVELLWEATLEAVWPFLFTLCVGWWPSSCRSSISHQKQNATGIIFSTLCQVPDGGQTRREIASKKSKSLECPNKRQKPSDLETQGFRVPNDSNLDAQHGAGT